MHLHLCTIKTAKGQKVGWFKLENSLLKFLGLAVAVFLEIRCKFSHDSAPALHYVSVIEVL